MESVLGAISTASTATGRPSSVRRQPVPSRSSPMTRVFSLEGDASWTSYFMAGGPVARGGLPASSEKAGPGKKRTERRACPIGWLAKWQRRWQRRRKRSLLADFRSRAMRRSADGAAIRQATWYGFRHGENRVLRGYGGRGRRWS